MKRSLPLAFIAAAAVVLLARTASAEDLVIKQPGAHPSYSIEIEPEGIIDFGRNLKDGPGAGIRLSIPLVHNGFVSSINNSVAITFGVDKDPLIRNNRFYFPAALQWNFWLATHWTVFGEAGVLTQVGDGDPKLYPALFAGGRYHFSESVALTLRVSAPYVPAASIGVSFFL